MKRQISFQLDGEEEIIIEVEDSSPGGMQRVNRSDERGVEQSGKKFMDALEHIRPAAEMVLESFQKLNAPDEINLEFGMTFDVKAGAILTSVGSGANFKVSLKWTNPKTEPKTEGTGA
ncbi:MAG: CU044_2847 family protein [Desulfococcaceae bacterium]